MVGSKDLPPSTTPFFPNTFLRNQFRTKAQTPPKTTDLSNKVAVITGGNTGLGLEAASQLLSYKLNHLILGVRSQSKGETAVRNLRAKHRRAKIEVWVCDMASYDSIQTFAQRVGSQLPRVDIAILNAGLSNTIFKRVASTKHEEVVQINYLSTALLAILLLPSLKKNKAAPGSPGGAGRLTIVNAALALTAKFPNLNDRPILSSFDNPSPFDPNEQYCSSKLLAHMFLWKLVEHVNADDVIINLVDPGFLKGTELARDVSGGAKVGMALFAALTARSLRVGASTLLDAVLVKDEMSHGGFIMSYLHP